MMTGPAPSIKPTTVALLLACLAAPVSAGGEASTLSTDGARLSMGARTQDEAMPDAPAAPARYGAEGTEWILFGTGLAHDFDENTDLALSAGYSRFLVDDVEWLLELAGWYHSQQGDDALSLNPAMEFRWHFFNNGDTTAFLNAGIGVLGATDNVPDLGSGFNFTPRAGVGMTQRIADDGTRLIAGVRWHHISNARFNGEDRNPSRDAPFVYVQLAVPF